MLPYKTIDGKRQQGITGFYAPKEEHSKKPDIMRQMIEKVSYMPAIELFARQKVDGWDCWGNEVSENIDIQSANKTKNILPKKLF